MFSDEVFLVIIFFFKLNSQRLENCLDTPVFVVRVIYGIYNIWNIGITFCYFS